MGAGPLFQIELPRIIGRECVAEIQIQTTREAYRSGQKFDTSAYSGGGQVKTPYSSGVMNTLANTIGRQVNIMCDSVVMPGHDLQTQEVQYGSEPTRN